MAAGQQYGVARQRGGHTPFVAKALRAARTGLDGLWILYWNGDDAAVAGRIHLPEIGRVLQLDIAERKPMAAEHDLLRVLSGLADGGDVEVALRQLRGLRDTVGDRILHEATALRVHELALMATDPAGAVEVGEAATEVGEALERVVTAAEERGHTWVARQALAVHGRSRVAAARAARTRGDAAAEAAAVAAAGALAARVGTEVRWWGHAFGKATWHLEAGLLARASGEGVDGVSAADRAALAPRQLRAIAA